MMDESIRNILEVCEMMHRRYSFGEGEKEEWLRERGKKVTSNLALGGSYNNDLQISSRKFKQKSGATKLKLSTLICEQKIIT